jgi:hypothetical protein
VPSRGGLSAFPSECEIFGLGGPASGSSTGGARFAAGLRNFFGFGDFLDMRAEVFVFASQ